MANPIVRIYDSEDKAREAVGKLNENGFYDDVTFLLTPSGEGGAANALKAGRALGDKADLYVDRLAAGRSLVVCDALPGTGRMAEDIMDGVGPVDTDFGPAPERDPWGPGAPLSAAFYIPVLTERRPAPFSGAFGLPTLTYGRSTFGELASPHFHVSSMLGMSLLSKAAAPLSRLVGLATLIRKAAPLSSSVGLPLLSRRAAPLSSSVGLKLLSKNPAPLSSLLSLPLLAQPR